MSKAFGRTRAVDAVDLEVRPGETVALLGPNGAGKTTTIGLLLGLLSPDTGTTEALETTPRQAIADGRIGAMLQQGGLTSGVTVRELLSFVHDLYPEPLDTGEVLDTVGLARDTERLVTRLSGGQAQRLRLALALVGDPDVLVLDEPTAGMDVEARHAFWTTMHAHAAAGRTILFATHYLKEADEAAGRVVVMVGGSVVFDGPVGELKAAAGERTVRCTLGAEPAAGLDALPGVASLELRGDTATLHSTDADATVKALLALRPHVRDLEVAGADLEEAYLALTGET